MPSLSSIKNNAYLRADGRLQDELRAIQFQLNIAPYAAGSVLVRFGNTQVICSATLENKVPAWMIQQGISGGWLTAEYTMLPYSTLDRKARSASTGKIDGRCIEIQRLIGRALRAVIDLQKMPGTTLWIDCDVLQADGGTRTTAINGAYIAARIAIEKAMKKNIIKENPFKDAVAAISIGLVREIPLLDLNYVEDKAAQVDANLVMTGEGHFVELQSSGEEATFSQEQLDQLVELGKKGIQKITQLQKQIIEESILKL